MLNGGAFKVNDWEGELEGRWKRPGGEKVQPQGEGAGNYTFLNTYFAYFILCGSDNEYHIVGLAPYLTDERSKIQPKVGKAIHRTEVASCLWWDERKTE